MEGAMRKDDVGHEALTVELERAGTAPEAIRDLKVPGAPVAPRRRSPKGLGQIVLVLQGGGALGAYQVGAYEALHDAGVEPDWVIGTSIGAINASLIAGHAPEARLPRLPAFWRRLQHGPWLVLLGALPMIVPYACNLATIGCGIPACFKPNLLAFAGPHIPLG